MIPEMPPQRNAKPRFALSSIIERAAQHLDWTVAFGMRHNTLRGVEETTSQRPLPDPSRIARASRLRSSHAGGRRLLSTSRLSLALLSRRRRTRPDERVLASRAAVVA